MFYGLPDRVTAIPQDMLKYFAVFVLFSARYFERIPLQKVFCSASRSILLGSRGWSMAGRWDY
jgi:hypothetical protein